MTYIKWYIQLKLLIFKNTLFKDRKTASRTMFMMIILLVFQIGLIGLIYNLIFWSSFRDVDIEVLIVFFLFVVMWIYTASFASSMHEFIKHFIKSPELNYLMTMPIPSNYVFLMKFIDHIIKQVKSSLFFVYAFLAAFGLSYGTTFFYYILIIPIFALITIIPSALGVLVALIGIRLVSIKQFSYITATFSFLVNIIFAFLMIRSGDMNLTGLLNFISWLNHPIVIDLIPIAAAVKLFTFAIAFESSIFSFIFLVITTMFILFISFKLSKRIFFVSWSKNQDILSTLKKGDHQAVKSVYHKNRSSSVIWVFHEWKMAMRNQDMFMGTIFMFLFYLGSIIFVMVDQTFKIEPFFGIGLLMTVAATFNIISVSVVFMPAEIVSDKSLYKKRYWLLKTLPLSGTRLFFIQALMYGIPAYLLSLSGILLFMIISGFTFVMLVVVAILLAIIMFGSASLYVALEMLALTEFFEKRVYLGNIMSLISPIIYSVLSVGVITLYLGKPYMVNIKIFSTLFETVHFDLVLIISNAVVIATLFLSIWIFNVAWKKIEI